MVEGSCEERLLRSVNGEKSAFLLSYLFSYIQQFEEGILKLSSHGQEAVFSSRVDREGRQLLLSLLKELIHCVSWESEESSDWSARWQRELLPFDFREIRALG